MQLVTAAVVLALIWSTLAVQRTGLQKRQLLREFWVAVGFGVLATVGTLVLSLGIRMPSLVRVLSAWFWIP